MDEPQTVSREANVLLVRENPTSLDHLLENDPATGFSENLDFCDLLQLQRVDRRISAAVSLITDAKWQKYLQFIKQNRKCIKEIVIGTRYIKSSIDYVAPLIEIILTNKIIKEIRISDTSYSRELEDYESPTSPHLLSIQKIILCIETCAQYIPSKNECSHIPAPGFETIKDFVPDFERDCQCVDSIGKLVEAARSLKGDFKLSAKEAHEWLNGEALTQKNLLIKTNAYVEHLPRFVNLKSLIIGDNGTYRIPNEVLELPRLKTLRVLCESVVFPEDFHRLTSLTELSIDAFPACFWDEGSSRFRVPTIEKFANLRKLTVTEFGSVTVQDLPSLEEIDYNMGGLKVTRCPRLNHLNVAPNKSIEI
ncbi:MAG: hypothetical protein KDK40_03065, partial [Chlamydiia bacterium]|nr:hypothetical protein [Chlamydiia bacterium]